MYAISFNHSIDIEFAELVEPVGPLRPTDGHGTLTTRSSRTSRLTSPAPGGNLQQVLACLIA
jgi:hypothetical protein